MVNRKSGTVYRPGSWAWAVSRTGAIPAWLIFPSTSILAPSIRPPELSRRLMSRRAGPAPGGVGEMARSRKRPGLLLGASPLQPDTEKTRTQVRKRMDLSCKREGVRRFTARVYPPEISIRMVRSRAISSGVAVTGKVRGIRPNRSTTKVLAV